MASAPMLREPNDEFWRSQVYGDSMWVHTPFIVIDPKTRNVRIYPYVSTLLRDESDENIIIIKAWGGQWRSDHFTFTLDELRKHSKEASNG